MKKPDNPGRKLLCLAGLALLLLLWQLLELPCLIRAIIGIPCPGCGMTRAWLAALQLDLSSAFAWHPMFWCVPIGVVFILYDGKVFFSNKVNALILGVLAVGIFAVYLARLLGFLGGFSLI